MAKIVEKEKETKIPVTVGDGFVTLGMLLDEPDTTLLELEESAKAVGLVIQYRIVPLNDTMYNLIIPKADVEDVRT